MPRMTGAVGCSQMLYWQSGNQWARLRPGCQKGDGKAWAENLSELPASIAGAGDTVLIHKEMWNTEMCFPPVYQHHQKGQGLRGFPYDPTYREGSECSLEAHTPLELPSTLGHAERAVKNKIPATRSTASWKRTAGQRERQAQLTNLLEFGEEANKHVDGLRHGGVQWNPQVCQWSSGPSGGWIPHWRWANPEGPHRTEQVDKYVADELQ